MAVEWRGIEIHPEIPPEGLDWPPYLRARFGGMSDKLREEAQKAGLPLVVPEMIPNSLRALEASEYARAQGQHEAFHKNIFHRFYGLGQDLSDWETLRAAAAEVGLDPHEMQQMTESGKYTAVLSTHRQEMFALGATGVPLYILDNQYAIIGLQPYAAFQEVMGHVIHDK